MIRKTGLWMSFIVILIFIAVLGSIFANGTPAWLSAWFNSTQENLTGKAYTVSEYDDFGNLTLQLRGDGVGVGLLENSANFDEESTGFKSEVLEITLDGKQAFQVGNTCVIAEEGIPMVTDFSVPEEIDTSDGRTSFMPADRFINDWRNKIGQPMVIIVSSQMGVPIGVFQGENVYVEIPTNLPKTTLITIDGKSLYLHRTNYTIIEASAIAE